MYISNMYVYTYYSICSFSYSSCSAQASPESPEALEMFVVGVTLLGSGHPYAAWARMGMHMACLAGSLNGVCEGDKLIVLKSHCVL